VGAHPKVRVTLRLKPGSYKNACVGLGHLYTKCGVDRGGTPVTRFLWEKLSLYLKGSTKTSAQQREALGMRTVEGKDPIPIEAYNHLANLAGKRQSRVV
jgi:hypothetical protein